MSSLTSSGRLAQEMAGTIDNARYEDSDEDSDWDRYSYGEEDDRFSSSGTGSGRNIGGPKQSGQLDIQQNRRVAETSIFGLTDKRRPEPLR